MTDNFKQGDAVRYGKQQAVYVCGDGITCTIEIEGRFTPYVPVAKLKRVRKSKTV
jgi:hypothetical protein